MARYLPWCRSLQGTVGITAQPHAIDLTVSCVGVVVCCVVSVLLVVWSIDLLCVLLMCVAHVVVGRLVNVDDYAVLNVHVNGSVDLVVNAVVNVYLRVCGTESSRRGPTDAGTCSPEARWLGFSMLVLGRACSTALDTHRAELRECSSLTGTYFILEDKPASVRHLESDKEFAIPDMPRSPSTGPAVPHQIHWLMATTRDWVYSLCSRPGWWAWGGASSAVSGSLMLLRGWKPSSGMTCLEEDGVMKPCTTGGPYDSSGGNKGSHTSRWHATVSHGSTSRGPSFVPQPAS